MQIVFWPKNLTRNLKDAVNFFQQNQFRLIAFLCIALRKLHQLNPNPTSELNNSVSFHAQCSSSWIFFTCVRVCGSYFHHMIIYINFFFFRSSTTFSCSLLNHAWQTYEHNIYLALGFYIFFLLWTRIMRSWDADCITCN